MRRYISLSILSGLLFALSWPAHGIPVLIFFAFVPLMLLEHHLANFSRINNKKTAIFGFSFLSFFIWNICTTWWLFNSKNPDGSHSFLAVAIPTLFNSVAMGLVFLFYHIYKKRIGTYPGLLFLVALWICFEKFHTTWELSWPWLTLGNVFAGWHQWVQWYDTTGVFGGSLWILSVNVFTYYAYRLFQVTRKRSLLIKNIIIFLGMLLLPLGISLIKYQQLKLTPSSRVNVVLLQPDLDPYTEKYNRDSLTIVHGLLDIAKKHAQGKVDFFIAPETAVPGYGSISERGFNDSEILNEVNDFTKAYPQSTFLTGASTHKIYPHAANTSHTAYFIENPGVWVDSYNTALQIIPNQTIQTYHKGRLVPGVELFPYINILKPLLGNAMFNFGGTIASLGSDPERKVFSNPFNTVKIAPIICYESIYGEYVTEYLKKGANLLAIMTNDSWWGNSPGYRQLLVLAKLRAIETRREVVRAANSGVSAHINARGDIIESLPYGAQGAIQIRAQVFEGETPYVKYGDVIYRIALFVFGFLFIYFWSQIYLSRKNKVKK
ncbi:apolipoprotein N-acyltransferase [Elizabethkingia argentiflava]|uniref:Apolipoprotein N-acyltransferase n=1 Tax=Elizabethkingia argenteiflava TaxID=2681556 RepID=A0A845PWF8_9FLAO|nr:apolipoprotein N-acyltransferase [Elizabethkingia argenteiflava]NAW51965.1 apolipoprotein N-acyltransferase [Elizabethkingia argenteiflava]